MKKIILIGGGGHFKSCVDVIENTRKYEIIGVLDNNLKKSSEILGFKYLGTDKFIDKLLKKTDCFLITVGQLKDPKPRISIFKKLLKLKTQLPYIISKNAYLSKRAIIKKGTIVMHNAFINSNAEVGNNCIINTGAIIEHDCVIKDNSHISTNVTLNGSVEIKENCFIGSNTVVIQGVTIGHNNVIPAGSVIKKNIPDKKE